MDRRGFLRRAAVVTAGALVADELEVFEHVRRLFPSAPFPEQQRLIATFDYIIGADFARAGADRKTTFRRELRLNQVRSHGWWNFVDSSPMPEGVGQVTHIERFDGPRRVARHEIDWMTALRYNGTAKLEIGFADQSQTTRILLDEPIAVAQRAPDLVPASVTSYFDSGLERSAVIETSKVGMKIELVRVAR